MCVCPFIGTLLLRAEISLGDRNVVYKPVSRDEIARALLHMRDLYRGGSQHTAAEVRAHERREAGTKTLLSNLARTTEHPTLHTLLDIANMFSLTLAGVHRLFGYDLDELRSLDHQLNGGKTRIIESYAFERDLPIDLPSQLSADQAFAADATLSDLVSEWQRNVPIRALDDENWRKPGTFYVQVGTEDSLGSSLPPGAIALVEPISVEEQQRPNPRKIYFLQFGNGYRCSRCVVTRGKLLLIESGRQYHGPQQFVFPGGVRVAGRIRMFALGLPSPNSLNLQSLPRLTEGAPLVLPWEQTSLAHLLETEHRRFKHSGESARGRAALDEIFRGKLTSRTERRYRRPTASQPHVNTLIQIALSNVTRYTDTLRSQGVLPSDRGRFSLDTLLNASSLDEIRGSRTRAQAPQPAATWEARRREFPEWPPLLSLKFPQLQSWDERIVRLSRGIDLPGVEPPIVPGSLLLLEEFADLNPLSDTTKAGWSRPLHALRRGTELVLGYLNRDGTQFVIDSNQPNGAPPGSISGDELPHVRLVSGIAVPV